MALSRYGIALIALTFAPVLGNAAIVSTFGYRGCSVGCAVIPFGTITLEMGVTGTVHVDVLLAADYGFRNSNDSNHWSFAFNLTGGPATITNITSGGPKSQTFVPLTAGPYNMNPFGTFQYVVDCTTCVSGAPTNPANVTRSLSFDVSAAGLTPYSFVTNANGYQFAADVVGVTAAAGIGHTGNVASTPEPATFLSVLAVVGGLFLRRRFSSSAARA